MRAWIRSAAGAVALSLALGLAPVVPAAAADQPDPQLQAEIDGLLKNLDAGSNGIMKWEGAERTDLRKDGETTIADFTKARISLGAPGAKPGDRVSLLLDHVEVRRSPAADGGTALAIALPHETKLRTKEGEETTLSLEKANVHAVLDAKSGRARETALDIATGRLADSRTGDWIEFGPLSIAYKLVSDGSGWHSPVAASVGKVKFMLTEGPVAGTIEHIAYNAQSAGPDLAALTSLRDRLRALREKPANPPQERLEEAADLIPSLMSQFSLLKGELSVGVTSVHAQSGDSLVTFDKASVGGELAGLSGEKARWRVDLAEDGLSVSPTLLEAGKVPQHLLLQFGVEDVATAPLRTMIEAGLKSRQGATPADKQLATAQLLGAAAALDPVFRIYDLAVKTRDVGITGKLEAKGSPLAAHGLKAMGDFSVRGIAALGELLDPAGSLPAYLPLLEQIGTPEKGPHGMPRLGFHLVSAAPKWLTINGTDVSAWFMPDSSAPGELPLLRPAHPAMAGAEVHAVQGALAAAGIKSPQSGLYDPATAVAVAQFQKANGLNSNGVVDAPTRRKLGLSPGPGKGSN
jgi:hypothetical protein